MKLFRRKPEYASAMPVHKPEGFIGDIEYAVQPCDESGNPLSTHLVFMAEDEFQANYQPHRVRPNRTKSKTAPKKKNNKPKITSVKLNEIEDIYAESEPGTV